MRFRELTCQSGVVQAQKLETSLSIRLLQQQQQQTGEGNVSCEGEIGGALKELVCHIETSWRVHLCAKPAGGCTRNTMQAVSSRAMDGLTTLPL